jgi:hypothetical protein
VASTLMGSPLHEKLRQRRSGSLRRKLSGDILVSLAKWRTLTKPKPLKGFDVEHRQRIAVTQPPPVGFADVGLDDIKARSSVVNASKVASITGGGRLRG